MSAKHKSNDRRTFIKVLALAAAIVAVVGLSVWWFFDYTKDDGLIYPNVYVFGENLGGMTPEAAAAAIHAQTDSTYSAENLIINLPDGMLALSPAQTRAQLDVDALVQSAYGYGRGGNRWENTQARRAAEEGRFELDVMRFLTIDNDAIRTILADAAAAAQSTLTQPVVSFTGEVPELKIAYEKALESDTIHKTISITLGTPERSLNTTVLMELIQEAYYTNNFAPIDFVYDVVLPNALDLDALVAEHAIAPVDAVLNESDYSITHELLGYTLDLEALKALVAGAGEGETVTMAFSYVPATVTYAAIDATLFQDELGSVSSNHTNNSNRNTNLKLACQALNGKIIRPGETFSYNETLGKRTEAKGYKAAGAYVSGKTVETIGGGICQVSSTLYYACLKADLEIVERYAHSYMVSYVPYGMDATVSWGGPDYKFKNNTDSPIRIEAWVSGGQVHVKLIGTDTKDYYVKMTYETVDGPTEGKVVYQDFKWDNKEGYKDGEVLQTAYTGRTVKSYRVKYSKATNEKLSSAYEATSRYKSRDKIIARVAPKPTEPTETTPVPNPSPVPTEPNPSPVPTEPVETTAPTQPSA